MRRKLQNNVHNIPIKPFVEVLWTPEQTWELCWNGSSCTILGLPNFVLHLKSTMQQHHLTDGVLSLKDISLTDCARLEREPSPHVPFCLLFRVLATPNPALKTLTPPGATDRCHSTPDQEQAATNSDVPTTSTVTKEAGDAVLAACTTTTAMCAWEVPAGGAGSSEVEESSRATRSSEGSQGGDQDHKGDNAGSYVSINGTHALTKPTLMHADSGYLDHSSQHQQSVFAFHEPLLWPEIMDTANLSPCLHVPIKS